MFFNALYLSLMILIMVKQCVKQAIIMVKQCVKKNWCFELLLIGILSIMQSKFLAVLNVF